MELTKIGGTGYIPTVPKREGVQPQSSQTLGRSLVDAFETSQSTQRQEFPEAYGPEWLAEQIKNADDQAKETAKELKVRLNCQKIAVHIMAGDQVDPKDLQYLMENDSKAYQMAMAMRRPKEKPEECDRITEDEQSQSHGCETPQVDTSGSATQVDVPSAEGGGSVTC